jgi:hypothetical protein
MEGKHSHKVRASLCNFLRHVSPRDHIYYHTVYHALQAADEGDSLLDKNGERRATVDKSGPKLWEG